MDFTKWPQLVELTQLMESCEGETFADNPQNHNMLDACMKELTAVVVGVRKDTSKVSLVIAQCNFGDNGGHHDYEIDNMGDHGFCFPQGCMSAKSHGPVETKELDLEDSLFMRYSDITHRQNRLCDAKLGMLFQKSVWTDRVSGNVVKVEINWDLDCSCHSYERDY